MNFTKYSNCLVLLFCTQFAFSQVNFETTIRDNTSSKPIKGATCILIQARNRKMIGYGRSNDQGNLSIPLTSHLDSVYVWVLHSKYIEYKSLISNTSKPEIVDLFPQNKVLKEVIIKSNRAVTMNGDTVSYIADSFKLPPGASTEDLLKKLPGIQVAKDGTIKAQGKKVERVLVDGDDFFGEDASVATRNLDASMIDKVEVIDAATKKSEATGSEEDKMKIINLKLKDEAKKGFFGKLDQGYSNTNRYNSSQMLNIFQGNTKIAGYLTADNIRSRMNWQDMQDMGIQQNWTYDEDLDVWIDNNGDGGMSDNYQIIPQNLKAGGILTQKLSDGTGAIKAKYNYNQSKRDGGTYGNSRMFINDITQNSDYSSYLNSDLNKHSIGGSYEKAIDTNQKIYVNASANISQFNSLETSNSNIFRDSTLVNKTIGNSQNNSKKESYTIGASYERKFSKKGRVLGINADYTSNMTDGNKSNITNGWKYTSLQDSTALTQDQNTTNFLNGRNIKLGANFIEPLKYKGFFVEAGVSYVLTKNTSLYNTFLKNNISNIYDLKVNSLSNNYNYNVNALSETFKLNYKSKKFEWFIGTKLHQVAMLQDNLDSAETAVNRSFNYILPSAKFQWKYKRNSNLSLSFNKSIRPPDLDDIQPFTNNSNPNNIIIGNPKLTPAENYTYKISNNFWYPISQTNLWSSITYKAISNDFADSSIVNEAGQTQKFTTQVDGNYNLNLNLWYSFRIKKLGIEVSPGMWASLDKKSSYFNSQKLNTENLWSNFNLDFSKEIDSLLESRFQFSLELNRTNTDNPNFQNANNLTWKFETNHELQFLKTWKLKGELEYNIRPSNAVFAQSQTFALLNASIEKSFLKDNSLITKLYFYDILGQNNGVNRSMWRNMITENFNQVLTRYVMFSMIYKFKNKSKSTTNASEF